MIKRANLSALKATKYHFVISDSPGRTRDDDLGFVSAEQTAPASKGRIILKPKKVIGFLNVMKSVGAAITATALKQFKAMGIALHGLKPKAMTAHNYNYKRQMQPSSERSQSLNKIGFSFCLVKHSMFDSHI